MTHFQVITQAQQSELSSSLPFYAKNEVDVILASQLFSEIRQLEIIDEKYLTIQIIVAHP